jgi:cell division protein FtsB
MMDVNEIMNDVDFADVNNLAEAEEMLETLNTFLSAKEDTLESFLDDLDDSTKMDIFVEYASACGYDQCYPMCDLEDVIGYGLTALEVLEKVDLEGNFSLNDSHIWFDNTGELISGSPSDFLSENFYAGDITSWLSRNDYDSDFIDEWKDEYDEITERIEELEERIEELEDEQEDED